MTLHRPPVLTRDCLRVSDLCIRLMHVQFLYIIMVWVGNIDWGVDYPVHDLRNSLAVFAQFRDYPADPVEEFVRCPYGRS